MSKELVVSANRHETRVAIIEDEQVVEVYHQRENEYSLAGSIHKGRVTRVLPGMQSAFVDIGLDRDAFLYVSDFFEDNEEYDKIVTSVEEKVLKLDKPGTVPPPPPAPAPAPAQDTEIVPAPPEMAAAVAEPETNGSTGNMMANLPAPQPAAQAGQPQGQPQGDRGRRDEGDRRGRRGRRRGRGGKDRGRGGLPESKFYSPGRGPERREPEAEAEAPEPVTPPAPNADDFFVLPGESLAKYRGGPTDGGEEYAEDVQDGVEELHAGEERPEAETAAAPSAIGERLS